MPGEKAQQAFSSPCPNQPAPPHPASKVYGERAESECSPRHILEKGGGASAGPDDLHEAQAPSEVLYFTGDIEEVENFEKRL